MHFIYPVGGTEPWLAQFRQSGKTWDGGHSQRRPMAGKRDRWGSGDEVGGQAFPGHRTSFETISLSLLARWHFGPQFPYRCFKAGLGERRKLRQEG